MSEFDDKLNALLSDSNSMAQIMQLAQQLSGSEQQSTAPPSPPPSSAPQQAAAFSGNEMQLIQKFLPLLQGGQSNSNALQLLRALQPYLKPEKQGKIERAARLARLIHLGKGFLQEWEV